MKDRLHLGIIILIGLMLLLDTAGCATPAQSFASAGQQTPEPGEKSALYFVSVPQAAPQQPNAPGAEQAGGAPIIKRMPIDKQAQSEAVQVTDATSPLLPGTFCRMAGLHDSPNGRWIVIDTDCEAGAHTHVLEVRSGKAREVTSLLDQGAVFLNWSPDGNSLLLQVEATGDDRIVLANLTDGSVEQLDVPSFAYDAALSPDGQKVIYVLGRGWGRGSELWSMKRDGSNKELVLQEPSHIIAYASWSPAGDAIAYVRMADSTTPFMVGELWLADGNGQNRRKIAPADAGHGYRPVWSPDGKWVAFVGRENPQDILANLEAEALESNIYAAEVETGQVRAVTQFKGALAESPAWSPDGKHLALSANVDGVADIWLAETDTGKLRQMTRNAGARWPVWGGGGQ
jgi:Tol biopolymer transport system component